MGIFLARNVFTRNALKFLEKALLSTVIGWLSCLPHDHLRVFFCTGRAWFFSPWFRTDDFEVTPSSNKKADGVPPINTPGY